MRIGEREIGRGREPYVIAELGVNHNGSAETARALVDAAHAAGSDAVKFQFFRAELLMSSAARLAQYQAAGHATDPLQMLRSLELSLDDMSALIDRAHEQRLHAIVTLFSLETVEEAGALAWDAFKSASPDIINRPLLVAMAALGRPLIISTGAADLAEVRRAVTWQARRDIALLHCVSAYPTPDEEAALAGIGALATLGRFPIGYSDHTTSTDTGALAVAAGACILEKHLTLDRSSPGPDHAASLDPRQFADYVALARRAHRMLGPPGKSVRDVEKDVRAVSRQSLTTTRALTAGTVLSRGDLTIKRPGVGIAPYRIDEIVGRTLRRDMETDVPLREDDLR